jgi:di/tricarboxylate transporter
VGWCASALAEFPKVASQLAPRHLIALAIAVLAAGVAAFGPGDGNAPAILGLILLTIGLLATSAIPEYLTALILFALAMVFALAPASVVFSGFESAALWLIFGGMVLGVAVHTTGLGARLAHRLAPVFGTSYTGVIFGTLLTGMAFGFLMPSSMGRVVLLLPITLALAKRLGFGQDSRGYKGMVLAAGLGCFLPTFGILPANVPNVVLLGIAEELYDAPLTYGHWLLLHFPVLGLLKAGTIGGLIVALFPDRPRTEAREPAPGPLTAAERRLAVVVVLALAGWMTDFLHGISPAWISLSAAVVVMFPGFGLFGPRDFAKIDFGPVIYAAGILGLGALIAHSGWGALLGAAIAQAPGLGADQPLGNFATLVATGIGVGLASTLPGVPAVLTPLAGDLAEATGLSIQSVLMLQVPAFSTPLLPYQAPPLIVAMQIAHMRAAEAIKLVGAIALVTLAVLLPLDYLWWRLLGAI